MGHRRQYRRLNYPVFTTLSYEHVQQFLVRDTLRLVRTRYALGPYHYRGTSLMRNFLLLGAYSRPMPRALRWSYGEGGFLMSEVPLYS